MCPCVRDAKFSELDHGIVLVFLVKLGGNKGRKVTEPDFFEKISLCPNWAKCAQNGPKMRFFEFCRKVCPLMGTFFY